MTISLTDSTGAIDPTGATVTITNTDLNITLLSTTWQGEPIIANISTNTNYTVSVSAVDGVQPASQSYKAGWKTARNITFDYIPVDPDLYVDLGLPSGLKWAKYNIDVTQPSGFAASEFQYESSFFSWGNTDGHNPSSPTSFSPYNWGSGVNTEPYVSSNGAALTGNIPLSQDAARVNLGSPWRMPTADDFEELINNVDYLQADGVTVIDASQTNKLVTVNGVVGIYLKSKINGNKLFFPTNGAGHGTELGNRGEYGGYWSSTLSGGGYSWYFRFYNGGVIPKFNYVRYYGFGIRAVM